MGRKLVHVNHFDAPSARSSQTPVHKGHDPFTAASPTKQSREKDVFELQCTMHMVMRERSRVQCFIITNHEQCENGTFCVAPQQIAKKNWCGKWLKNHRVCRMDNRGIKKMFGR